MKKTYFQRTMEQLTSEKEANIQRLCKLSFDELIEMKKYYYRLYSDAKDMDYDEAHRVHFLKFRIIDEAIDVKTGNEEQTWDYLT